MVMIKLEDETRQGSCKILWRKFRLRASLLLVLVQCFLGGRDQKEGRGWALIDLSLSLSGREVGWGWALIRGRAPINFRMGACSRWALIRGWAFIRINTVIEPKKLLCGGPLTWKTQIHDGGHRVIIPGGGGTPIHYLYGYVPPKGVVILKLLF